MLSALSLHPSQVDATQRTESLRAMLHQHAWRLVVRVKCITLLWVLQLSHRGLCNVWLQIVFIDEPIPRCVVLCMSCPIIHEYDWWTFVTIGLLITKTECFTQCFRPAIVTEKDTSANAKCKASEIRFSLLPQLLPCGRSAVQYDCHGHRQQKKKKHHAKQDPHRLCAGHFDKWLRMHCDVRSWVRGGHIKRLARSVLN